MITPEKSNQPDKIHNIRVIQDEIRKIMDFKMAILSPSNAAAREHSLTVYDQVQQ